MTTNAAAKPTRKNRVGGIIVLVVVAVIIIAIVIGIANTSSCSTLTLQANIRFDGTQFTITNNGNSDWINVHFTLNIAYTLDASLIQAGHSYTVGAMQFAKSDGTRFDPFTTKPTEIWIDCDQGKYRGDWK
jgi:hypothetical protein